jgi:hypothetical protein
LAQPSGQRIDPAQSGKASEISIARAQFRAVLQGHRGQVRIRGQIPSRAKGLKQLAQHGKAEDLRRLYPLFVHHAMTTFSSPNVLRFLDKKLTAAGQIHGRVTAEVTSDLKRRQEGVRIKHRYNDNSVRLHDKAYTPVGSVLRAELTMEDPEDFKVCRRPEGNPDSPPA